MDETVDASELPPTTASDEMEPSEVKGDGRDVTSPAEPDWPETEPESPPPGWKEVEPSGAEIGAADRQRLAGQVESEPPLPEHEKVEPPEAEIDAADLRWLARQSEAQPQPRPRPARTLDRMMPHNSEAEEAVLGALLIDPDAIFKVAAYLTPADFYIERNGWVYEAVLALHDRREAVDFVTLCDELERQGRLEEVGGAAYITKLINTVPTSIHVEYYGRVVERAAIRRRLIHAAGEIAALGYQEAEDIDEVVDRAEQILFGVSQHRLARDLVAISQVVSDYYDRIDYLYRHGDELIGVPTGFPRIDRLLGGLQRSDLVIVAGRPAMGKTSLALNIAYNAALKNQRIAIFSLEMSNEQLVQRLIASETGISSHRLRTGKLKEEEWPRFTQAAEHLSKQMVFVDDTPSISAMQMRTKCRRLHAEHGLDLVIVDYLQLMQGDHRSENRVQEISYISRMLKSLARELNVPVVAASQLSRAVEQRHDKRPLLSDLRESGSIEQDADIVMFIYRDEVYNPETPMKNIAEVIVSKHRHGPTGTVELYFEKELTRFMELERDRVGLEEF